MRDIALIFLVVISIVVFCASLYFFTMFKLGDSLVERIFMSLFMTSWIVFLRHRRP